MAINSLTAIERLQKFVTEMVEQGVIQESHSPWNSPLFLVPKKDGTFRPVIDFRRVNAVTEDDHYPLPVLRDLLMCLGRGNSVHQSRSRQRLLAVADGPRVKGDNSFLHT